MEISICTHGCCCHFVREEVFGMVDGYIQTNEYSLRKACMTMAKIMLVEAIDAVMEQQGCTSIEAKQWCDRYYNITTEGLRARYNRSNDTYHINFGGRNRRAK